MPLVVGVTFKPVTKIYYFDPAEFNDLEPGEWVVVDTSRGRTLGTVILAAHEVPGAEISGALKPVLRRASAWDLVQQDQMEHREGETLQLCRERAATLGLEMKVVRVEYNFEGTSLLVYFTADQRVDFRTLVHDLAQALHTRVEMRQIGVRDEAKFLGGHGRCGRALCCASWLRDFTPVSIKMAKQQDLPLNPVEISGVCGRLLCCLSYENEFYNEAHHHMPRINSTVMTKEGPGKVRQVHVLRNSVTVLVQGPNESKMLLEVPIAETDFRDAAAPNGGPFPIPLLTPGEDDEADDLPETDREGWHPQRNGAQENEVERQDDPEAIENAPAVKPDYPQRQQQQSPHGQRKARPHRRH